MSESLYGQADGHAASKAPKAPGLMEQISGLFTEPSALFQRLRQAPSWLGPTLLVTATALTLAILWAMKVDVDAMVRPMLEANPRISADQVEQAISMQSKFMPVFAPIGVLFGIALGTTVPALIFFLLGKANPEGEAPTYVQALSATAVPNLFLLPQHVLILAMTLLRPVGGATLDKLNPASLGYFIHPENAKLGALLRHVDPFFIGVYVATYLALRHLLRLSPALAWTGTLVCACTTLAFRVMGAR